MGDPKFGSCGNVSSRAPRHPHSVLEVQEAQAGVVWKPWSWGTIPRSTQLPGRAALHRGPGVVVGSGTSAEAGEGAEPFLPNPPHPGRVAELTLQNLAGVLAFLQPRKRGPADSISELLQIRKMKCEADEEVAGKNISPLPTPAKGKSCL